jgi:hypothetical protein
LEYGLKNYFNYKPGLLKILVAFVCTQYLLTVMSGNNYIIIQITFGSRDSSVGIATSYEPDGPSSTPGSGPTQPSIQLVAGAISLGLKWQGRETDH